jgi:hypothetical protein
MEYFNTNSFYLNLMNVFTYKIKKAFLLVYWYINDGREEKPTRCNNNGLSINPN